MVWVRKPRFVGPIDVPVTATGATGAIRLWRNQWFVTCDLNGITLPAGSNALQLVRVPDGYRPVGSPTFHAIGATEPVIKDASLFSSYWNSHLTWVGRTDGSPARPTDALRGIGTWLTTDPMPTGGV